MAENSQKTTYIDPAYKQLSYINGKINDMSKNQLVEQLELFKLNTSGVKNVLIKRLKAFHKKRLIQSPNGQKGHKSDYSYEYFVVIDFEATCEEHKNSYPHEIIEFPAILVDASKQEVVDEFHSYVRPCLNKKLSDFCTRLTGITQATVDSSPPFPEVLKKFEEWLGSHNLGSKKTKYAIVTDGPWDMSRFMYLQCHISKIELPKWSHRWINIRKCYCNAYGKTRVSLNKMLEGMNMEFEGRAHSGISDSRNIARILVQMIKDGCNLFVNEKMFGTKITEISKTVGKKHFVVVTRAESSATGGDEDECESNEACDEDESDDDCDSERKQVNVGSKVSKTSMKEIKMKQLEEDLKSCEDLLYFISLRRS